MKHTEETKKKISATNKGKPPWNKGASLSEETKRKISASKAGIPLSEEHKQKLRLINQGKIISEATREKMSLARNTTGFRGVYFHSRLGKFVASIRVDGRNRHLGYFDDPEEAAFVAEKARQQYARAA